MAELQQKCAVCGCTENNACVGGCGWVKGRAGADPLCTSCEQRAMDIVEAISQHYDDAPSADAISVSRLLALGVGLVSMAGQSESMLALANTLIRFQDQFESSVGLSNA